MDNKKKLENYFARNLKYLRKANNISQETLGKVIDVDYSTIGKYETDQRSPSAENGIILSHYFGYTYDEMITKDLRNKNK